MWKILIGKSKCDLHGMVKIQAAKLTVVLGLLSKPMNILVLNKEFH